MLSGQKNMASSTVRLKTQNKSNNGSAKVESKTVRITYSDGQVVTKIFPTQAVASWYIYTEGDHVSKVEYL